MSLCIRLAFGGQPEDREKEKEKKRESEKERKRNQYLKLIKAILMYEERQETEGERVKRNL